MTARLAIAVALLLGASLAFACGDGGGDANGGGTNGDGGTPAGQESPQPNVTILPDESPTGFEAERDALAGRLDSIGVSIEFVPDDVREQLLESCNALADEADDERVDQICGVVEDALDNADPALLDVAVRELRQLQAE